MSKGILALLAAAIAFVVWQVRQRKAKVRLLEIDEGKGCVSCHGVNLTRQDGKARCDQCGYVMNLAFFQAAQVDSREVADVTRTQTRR